MSRPPWLAEVIAAFGQPEIGFSGPVAIGGEQRRCWVWFVSGENHNVAITQIRSGRYEVSAGGPSRTVRLYLATEPTDDDLRSVCALAWPTLHPRRPQLEREYLDGATPGIVEVYRQHASDATSTSREDE